MQNLKVTKKIFQSPTRWIFVLLILIIISSDQYTKILAKRYIDTADNFTLLGGLVKFSLVENHGGFLGVISNLPDNVRFFLLNICVSILLVGCLIYILLCKSAVFHNTIPLIIATGGGMSNLLDRFLHNGGVIDFVSLGIGNLRTGIFNLADVYILAGTFVLGFTFFYSPRTASRGTF